MAFCAMLTPGPGPDDRYKALRSIFLRDRELAERAGDKRTLKVLKRAVRDFNAEVEYRGVPNLRIGPSADAPAAETASTARPSIQEMRDYIIRKRLKKIRRKLREED